MIKFEIDCDGETLCSFEMQGDEMEMLFEMASAVDTFCIELCGNDSAQSYNYSRRALDYAIDQVHQTHDTTGDGANYVKVRMADFLRHMQRYAEKVEDDRYDIH